MRARPVLVALLVASLVPGACGGGAPPAGPEATSTTAATATAGDGATTATTADPSGVPLPAPGEAGSVVASEPIELDGIDGFRVTYLSEGVTGDLVEVSGVVLVPDGTPPEEGWPVVAWAHGTTGGADACAPSRLPGALGLASVLGGLTHAGFVVAATDYEGIGGPGPHPYLDGSSAARSVVDSVRAARALAAPASPFWVVAGHSQGGHAALWTAQEAEVYAPELELLGAVAIAPASSLAGLPLLAGGRGAAFLLLAVAGFLATEPDVDPATVLTPAGIAAMDVVEEVCLPGLASLYERPGTPSPLQPGAGAPGSPFGDHLAANEPATVAPLVPVLVVQGGQDVVVPPARTQELVERLCGLDAFVELRTYLDADHLTVVRVAAGDARSWISARFAGPPPASARTC